MEAPAGEREEQRDGGRKRWRTKKRAVWTDRSHKSRATCHADKNVFLFFSFSAHFFRLTSYSRSD